MFVWANKNKYTGKFDKDLKCGQGTLECINGDKYVGLWAQDFQSGQGVLKQANGDSYTGEFQKSKRNGHGVLIKNGDRYEGTIISISNF